MKRVEFLFQMPTNDEYFGGIASILSEYMDDKDLFHEHGIDINLLDYKGCYCKTKRRVIDKMLSLVSQLRYIDKHDLEKKSDICHIHSSRGWTLFKDLIIARHISRKYTCDIFLSIHFAEEKEILSKYKLIRLFELNILKNYVTQIIFLSKKTRDQFTELGISAKKTEVLYTFHTYKYVPLLNPQPQIGRLKMIFLGSLDKRKGIIDLLEAIENIKNDNVELHICGKLTDNSIKDEYNKRIISLGNRVIYHGYVFGKEKEKLLDESDVLVLPSYGEGMPIVIMEALSKGCAIICTNVGAIPELIDSRNGILFNPGDVDRLISAIQYLYHNRTHLEDIKKHNRKVGQDFYISNNIQHLSEIYNKG